MSTCHHVSYQHVVIIPSASPISPPHFLHKFMTNIMTNIMTNVTEMQVCHEDILCKTHTICRANLQNGKTTVHKQCHHCLSMPYQLFNHSYLMKNNIIDNLATCKSHTVITTDPKAHTANHTQCSVHISRQTACRGVSSHMRTETPGRHPATIQELSVTFGATCILLLLLLTQAFRKHPERERQTTRSIMSALGHVASFLQPAVNLCTQCVGRYRYAGGRLTDSGVMLIPRYLRLGPGVLNEPLLDDLQTQAVVITQSDTGISDDFLYALREEDPHAVPVPGPRASVVQCEDGGIVNSSVMEPKGIEEFTRSEVSVKKNKREECEGKGRTFGEWHGKFRWTRVSNARLLLHGTKSRWTAHGPDVSTSVRLLMLQAEANSHLRVGAGAYPWGWRRRVSAAGSVQ